MHFPANGTNHNLLRFNLVTAYYPPNISRYVTDMYVLRTWLAVNQGNIPWLMFFFPCMLSNANIKQSIY